MNHHGTPVVGLLFALLLMSLLVRQYRRMAPEERTAQRFWMWGGAFLAGVLLAIATTSLLG